MTGRLNDDFLSPFLGTSNELEDRTVGSEHAGWTELVPPCAVPHMATGDGRSSKESLMVPPVKLI